MSDPVNKEKNTIMIRSIRKIGLPMLTAAALLIPAASEILTGTAAAAAEAVSATAEASRTAEKASSTAAEEGGTTEADDSASGIEAPESAWLVSTLVYSVTQDGDTVSITYAYEYNDDGNPISRTLTGGNSRNVLFYEYDDQGREVREYTEKRQKVTSYDENGNIISEVSSIINSGDAADTGDADSNTTEIVGEIYQTVSYTYDTAGNLLSKITTDENGEETESYRYTYDEDERKLTYDHTSADDTSAEESWEYVYEEDGYHIIKSETGYIEYYNQDDRLESYTVQDDEGNTTSAAEYAYNDDETIESVSMIDGTVIHYNYTYDEQGNILTLVRHAENETFGTVGSDDYCEEYTYDDQGNILTYRYYILENGTEYDQQNDEYTYDENGNALSYQTTASDGTVTEYEYTYIRIGEK